MTPARLPHPKGRLKTPAETVETAPSKGRLNLGSAQAHVWRARLDQPAAALARFARTLLAPDEIARAARFHFEIDRRRFIARRGILRTILARYLGVSPSRVQLAYGPEGKPELADGGGGWPIHFNATHSGDLALYAVARAGEVGVDLEQIRQIPEWKQIAASAFSPRENAWLQSLPDEPCPPPFLRAWTRHEALLKASGRGLASTRGPALLNEETSTVRPLTPAPGFVGTLVVGRPGCQVACLTWPAALP